MAVTKIKKKPTKSPESAEKKMKIIQKKKAERIKEKLSGKNYSPIVAKAKIVKAELKKKVASQSPASSKKPLIKGTQDGKVKKTDTNKMLPLKSEVKEGLLSKKRTKPLKRKTEETNVEATNKKVKVVSSGDIPAKKKKQKDTSAQIGVLPENQPKPSSTAAVKIKNPKLQKKLVVKNKGTLDKKIKDAKNENSENVDQGLVKLKTNKVLSSTPDTVSKKVVKKSGKKAKRNSIANLKPISNIKTLKKNPSPSALKAKALRRQKIIAGFPERGVCYFSHIPHGFYEKELTKYCSQFGKVTGVYHPVSKDGNSRGYAFVEFLNKEVAQVVAETMNNYLMFNRLIKCEYVPPERQRPWVFKHKKSTKKISDEKREKALLARTRTLSKEDEEVWRKRRSNRINALHKKLAAMGVDYEFQVNDGSGEKQ